MNLDQLFAMLRQMSAKTLTLLPRNDNDQPLGLVVLVKDAAVQEFLELLEMWQEQKAVKLPDSYGWEDT